jgi:hypothetical protein
MAAHPTETLPPKYPSPSTEALEADFPVLAHILGEARFDRLARVTERAARRMDARPGELVETVVSRWAVRHDLRAEKLPSRLVADLAALEWAVVEVDTFPTSDSGSPLRRDQLPEDLTVAVLVPIPALQLIGVAFRLDAYIRRVREGRTVALPLRGDQTIAVFRPNDKVCSLAMTRDAGRLLSLLIQGAPVGEAMDTAIHRKWCTGIEEAVAFLDEWIGDGMFASAEVVPEHLLGI